MLSSGLCWVSCADCWSSCLPHFDPGPGRWPCCPEGLPAHGRGGQQAVPVHDGRPVSARHFLPNTVSGGYVAAATIGKTILALPAAAIAVAYRNWSPAGWTRTGQCPSFVTLGSRRASRFCCVRGGCGAGSGAGRALDLAPTPMRLLSPGCWRLSPGSVRSSVCWSRWTRPAITGRPSCHGPGATIEIVVIGLAQQCRTDRGRICGSWFRDSGGPGRSRRLPG